MRAIKRTMIAFAVAMLMAVHGYGQTFDFKFGANGGDGTLVSRSVSSIVLRRFESPPRVSLMSATVSITASRCLTRAVYF